MTEKISFCVSAMFMAAWPQKEAPTSRTPEYSLWPAKTIAERAAGPVFQSTNTEAANQPTLPSSLYLKMLLLECVRTKGVDNDIAVPFHFVSWHMIPFIYFLTKDIPWGALSGLSAPFSGRAEVLYAVDDSVFKKSKIFTINVATTPHKITKFMYIKDTHGVLASFNTTDTSGASIGFNSTKLALLINTDKTVNLDQEGIVAVEDGFWIAHEGSGNQPNVNSLNFLIKVDMAGDIKDVVSLPKGVNEKQTSNGFEGVTKEGDYLIAAFQREWKGDIAGRVRLGLYKLSDKSWKFVYYPLDPPESQFGEYIHVHFFGSLYCCLRLRPHCTFFQFLSRRLGGPFGNHEYWKRRFSRH